jgi:tRNA threonylcarbamoyladenosine biosynthesis protein TsaE
MTAVTLTTNTPQETQASGAALGELLGAGDVVALRGALGAGKTQFVKGLAAGLGVSAAEPVVSPTFVLIREYHGRLKLYHLDAYRLSGADELVDLGWLELIDEDGAVAALEWADRVTAAVPDAACAVDCEHAGGDRRRLRIAWRDDRLARLTESLRVRGLVVESIDTVRVAPDTTGRP